MLSIAYFVAKFRFDTAENEPAKNLQNFRKMHFSKMHFSKMPSRCSRCGGQGRLRQRKRVEQRKRKREKGSFSAVSKPNFASKYAFESSRRDLHNALLCTAPKSYFFQKISRICQNLRNFSEILRSSQFFKPIFCENFEIAAVQKDANLVELEKCCRTHIFLQNFVLIQPRTSPPKFCKIFEKCIFEKCIFEKCRLAPRGTPS